MANNNKMISAIDLGFGFSKYMQYIPSRNEFMPAVIPSLSIPVDSKNLDDIHLTKRNTTEVLHEGAKYEVGNDIAALTSGNSPRYLINDFYKSKEYTVLMKGVLKLMNVNYLDLLVLGVPVSQVDVARKYLMDTWTGEIDLDSEKIIKIRSVIVLAQPLGGFAHHASQTGNAREIQKQRNLIIDPGFFTVDWLLIDNMLKMKGSGSDQSGVSYFLKEIAKQMGQDHKNFTFMNRIDQYFFDSKPLFMNGKKIDFTPYLPQANLVLEKSVKAMLSELPDTQFIDNIIMIGGAAHIYLPFFQNQFPNIKIALSKRSQLSNVLGFFDIGKSIVK